MLDKTFKQQFKTKTNEPLKFNSKFKTETTKLTAKTIKVEQSFFLILKKPKTAKTIKTDRKQKTSSQVVIPVKIVATKKLNRTIKFCSRSDIETKTP